MVVLYIETKQFLYEDNELETAFNAAKDAVKKGKAIKLIPDSWKIESEECRPLEQRLSKKE